MELRCCSHPTLACFGSYGTQIVHSCTDIVQKLRGYGAGRRRGKASRTSVVDGDGSESAVSRPAWERALQPWLRRGCGAAAVRRRVRQRASDGLHTACSTHKSDANLAKISLHASSALRTRLIFKGRVLIGSQVSGSLGIELGAVCYCFLCHYLY